MHKMTKQKTNPNWFNVSTEGLKQLQLGKPKHYLIRELIQNAWDEKVKVVKVLTSFNNNLALVSVEDDSPEGFNNLEDAYTLFKPTYKRTDAEKRGRFNLGEKQAFSICENAIVETTKGTVTFNKFGRDESSKKRKSGSKISVEVKMTSEEYDEMLAAVNIYLIPSHIQFFVNGVQQSPVKPLKIFSVSLVTEISDGQVLKKVTRKTDVELFKQPENYLYEMGIPVMKLDCSYSINVLQKIPLSADRETVSMSYLKEIYAETLNNTWENISEEECSQQWIRDATSSSRIIKEAVHGIINKRYGDKVCVADTFDMNSVDEAISNGYRVLRGNELSKEEWENVRKFNALDSSSGIFGKNFINAKPIKPNAKQTMVADYAKKIAKRLLGINIRVTFVNEREMVTAQFGGNELTFNISKLGNRFFDKPVSDATTNLIIHELGHHAGNHTEEAYHSLITKMAGELVMLALEEPEFFKELK